MKKFFAALLLVGVLGFVGCGEKSDGEKLDDAKKEMEKKAGEVKEDMKKIAE